MIQVPVKIEKMVFEIYRMTNDGESSLLDALIYYCDKNDIELETAADVIKDIPHLHDQFRDIAKSRNLLKE